MQVTKLTLKLSQHTMMKSALVAIALLLVPSFALGARAQDEATFPPNPLEMTEPDPLLPRLVIERPLSPQERSVLTTALDELWRQAEARLQAGDLAGAFEIWNRELRLRRVLGVREEVESLSRVGEIAWRENQVTEVRVITQRLQEIEQEVKAQRPLDYELLFAIADAYQKLRAYDPAVSLYQEILVEAQQQQNLRREQQILTSLAELHLAWFEYAQAGAAYQELLAQAQAAGDRPREIEYLRQLAYAYQESNQPDQAIAAQQQLVNLYEQQQEYVQIPPLKLAIGNSFLALDRPDRAATNYQEAFAVARSVQQYGYASDALHRLGSLYRSLNRPDDALVVYQLLLDVERQSYNNLGVMNTYDLIGQIYREQGNSSQALAAFRQGLQLAQELNYKVAYFTTQIEQMNQPSNQP